MRPVLTTVRLYDWTFEVADLPLSPTTARKFPYRSLQHWARLWRLSTHPDKILSNDSYVKVCRSASGTEFPVENAFPFFLATGRFGAVNLSPCGTEPPATVYGIEWQLPRAVRTYGRSVELIIYPQNCWNNSVDNLIFSHFVMRLRDGLKNHPMSCAI